MICPPPVRLRRAALEAHSSQSEFSFSLSADVNLRYLHVSAVKNNLKLPKVLRFKDL